MRWLIASRTIPIYEYREKNWFERHGYDRYVNEQMRNLLGRDYTWWIIGISSLVIIASAIVAGLLLVG